MPKKKRGFSDTASLLKGSPTTVTGFMIGSRNRPGFSRYTSRDDVTLAKITARWFPLGFSIIKMEGFWYDGSALRNEESRLILVAGPVSDDFTRWRHEVVFALQQKEIIKLSGLSSELFVTDVVSLSKMMPNRRKRLP